MRGKYGLSGWALRGMAAGTVFGLVPAAGCGSSAQPPLLSDFTPDASGGLSSPDADTFADSGPPNCSVVGPGGGICACVDVPLLTDVPNLYFVLDRSGSMNNNNKWTTVRTVIGQVMVKVGPRANFGATIFPNPNSGDCSPGIEVAPVRHGDSPSGTYGPVTQGLLKAVNVSANGGTPTAATFSALTPKLKSLTGRTFAILATDGGPNCDPIISCGVSGCIANIENADPMCTPNGTVNCCDPSLYGPTNCLDGAATVSAVAALKSAGVPTYVIGVPGSGPYSALLDQLAEAGGAPRATSPFYYQVNTTDQAAFAAALSQIAAKITATCTLPLGQNPPDPSMVNVYLDGSVVPQPGPDGWTLTGMTVTLLGATCQKVLNGDVLDVRVVAGCPTVTQ